MISPFSYEFKAILSASLWSKLSHAAKIDRNFLVFSSLILNDFGADILLTDFIKLLICRNAEE